MNQLNRTPDEISSLFSHYLDVCNEAISAHQDEFPYKQIVGLSEQLAGGRDLGVSVYSGEKKKPEAEYNIRLINGRFVLVNTGESAEAAVRTKLKTDYLQQVVDHREDYIEHPEKLDWDWMKSRFKVGKFRSKRSKEASGGDFENLLVADVMTREIESADPRASIREAASQMREHDVGALVVIDQGEPVGIVTDRDLTIRGLALGLDPTHTSIEQVMTPTIASCEDQDPLATAAELMKQQQIRRLVVLNQSRKPIGILSVGDLAARSSGHEQAAGIVASSSHSVQ